MVRSIAIALLIASACGCSPPTQRSAIEIVENTEQQSAPIASDWRAFEWLSGARDGRFWLNFQPDESDNVQMAFECTAGSGAIAAEAFDPRQEGRELVLISGEVRGVYSAEAVRDPTGEFFGDAVKARAVLPVDEPVILAFRLTGALSSGDPATAFRPATAEELGRIGDFFARCEG